MEFGVLHRDTVLYSFCHRVQFESFITLIYITRDITCDINNGISQLDQV